MRIHFKGRRLFMHGGRIHAHPHSGIHKRMNICSRGSQTNNTKMDHQTNISKLKTELSKMNINKNIRKKIRF